MENFFQYHIILRTRVVTIKKSTQRIIKDEKVGWGHFWISHLYVLIIKKQVNAVLKYRNVHCITDMQEGYTSDQIRANA